MVMYQVKQGNYQSYEIFKLDPSTDKANGGFDWEKAPEGFGFWYEVIHELDFDIFYKKYPIEKPKYLTKIDKLW